MKDFDLAEDFDLDVMVTNRDRRLGEITMQNPVLLVFLRHFGCTFCREAIDELGKKRTLFASKGIDIIFVHMAEDATADEFFKKFNFPNAEHIADPMCAFYKEFGLVKGTTSQLFGFNNWGRVVESGIIKGHFWGREIGDGFQMPGVFILKDRAVVHSFIHKLISDQPDYIKMTNECCSF